jgi:two-component system sensor histidine kinase UhpB
VKDWQRRYPTVSLSLRQDFSADLGPSVTLAIYRVVQEGLINALRHAQATKIDTVVESDGHSIVVTLTDDGVGLPADWARPGHFGLRGLAERVKHLGGELTVTNRSTQGPSRGVKLKAEIPLTVAS